MSLFGRLGRGRGGGAAARPDAARGGSVDPGAGDSLRFRDSGAAPPPVAAAASGRREEEYAMAGGPIQCQRCGHANSPGSRFCSNCGNPLNAASAAGIDPRTGERAAEMTSTMSLLALSGVDFEADYGDPLAAAAEGLSENSALLLVQRGPNAGSRFLLDAESTSAGRSPDSDIFLDDVTVSRRHAEFLRGVQGFLVRDVGSHNGTYVNRERIEEVLLNTGDEVQIGKYRLVFVSGRR